MCGFSAFLCFMSLSIEYLWVLDCWSANTNNLKTLPWTLGTFNEHFPTFSRLNKQKITHRLVAALIRKCKKLWVSVMLRWSCLVFLTSRLTKQTVLISLCVLAGCHGSRASWWLLPKKTWTWWRTSSSASSTGRFVWCQAARLATGRYVMESWLWARERRRGRRRTDQRWSSSMTPCGLLWRRTSCTRSPWLPRNKGSVW